MNKWEEKLQTLEGFINTLAEFQSFLEQKGGKK